MVQGSEVGRLSRGTHVQCTIFYWLDPLYSRLVDCSVQHLSTRVIITATELLPEHRRTIITRCEQVFREFAL